MEEAPAQLEPPRIEDRKSFLVAGLSERYTTPKVEGIPAQWQRFVPYMGKIPGQVGWTSYGVCFNMDGRGKMDYMCGVEVADNLSSAVPAELSQLRVADQRYAVFLHRGHISKIGNTWQTILQQPQSSQFTFVDAPQFETYDENFNPQTGNGEVEIWIPILR